MKLQTKIAVSIAQDSIRLKKHKYDQLLRFVDTITVKFLLLPLSIADLGYIAKFICICKKSISRSN